MWEVFLSDKNDGTWVAMSPTVNSLLTQAEADGNAACSWTERGQRYHVDWDSNEQVNEAYGTRRSIRKQDDAPFCCDICADDKPRSELCRPVTGTCTHAPSLCKDCLATYVGTRLDKNDTALRCPAFGGCGELVSLMDLARVLGPQHRAAVRFDRVELVLALRNMPEFRFCAHGCGSGQLVVGGDGDDGASFFACGHCGERSCVRHKGARWHPDLSCDAYDEQVAALVQSGDDEALVRGVVELKNCPGCDHPISKADGCDVMACCGRGGDDECRRWTRQHPDRPCTHNPNGDQAHCGQRFCWLCLGNIDADGTRHHAATCQWHESNM